jgi:hypothetical protein
MLKKKSENVRLRYCDRGQTSIQCVGGHSLTTFQNTELCLYERKICHKRFIGFMVYVEEKVRKCEFKVL